MPLNQRKYPYIELRKQSRMGVKNSILEILISLNCHQKSGSLNLELLDLSANELTTLPPEFGQLTNLALLDLSDNKFLNLPSAINKLSELTILDFSNNKLTSLSSEIVALASLKELDLSGNQLTSLYNDIGQLNKLTYLDLSNNQLSVLPPEIGQLENLEFLDISDNQLTTLPPEIEQLTNLTTLELSNNPIAIVPKSITNLTNLKSIAVSDKEVILYKIEEAIQEKSKELYLRNSNLTELSSEIGQLENLELLDLSANELTSLPLEIGQLTNLTILDLSDNKFLNLPSAITKLSKLPVLDLSNNKLTSLSSVIVALASLKELDLSGNQLTSLLNEIGQLGKLTYLDLSNNQLSALPPEIWQLENLEFLDISDNQLTTLPPEIEQLTNLTTLKLSNNPIATVPKSIANLTNLNSIAVNNTELPSLPPEIKNINAIIAYYTSDDRKRQLNETKILVVGQGSVGKTSLVNRLVSGIFNPNENKTEGIQINHWNLDSKSGGKQERNRIRLNIWDFGGQEIMHATHQFFLTKRSLYLLVLDARLTQEENRVEYWLKIIQSFGGESPVLIVGNKTDQHPLDIDRTGLQKKYPNIVRILETSAKDGLGIEILKTEIAKQVDTLPHVHDQLPMKWFTVKSNLEKLGKGKNFITQDEYLDLCSASDVTDETGQHTLIGFLHDLGVVLHFQDDPRLEALGILNPQWVTNGVYKIINSHELFQNQGTLTLPMLNIILDMPEYPSHKRLFIVDMMKKFELCYDIEPDKSFLIPDLLPKDEPFTGNQDWKSALTFQYHYKVLPSSIITRFIVRMHAFIHKTVWRSGVVLKSGGNIALVKSDTEDRKIYIWVSGDENTRRDFLSAIRMEFSAIHNTIAKIEAVEKVPVPNTNAIVDYEHLLKLERKGIQEYIPEGMDDEIKVRELLDGVRPAKNQALKVFISYSHQNKSFVKKLAGKMEDQGMKVWWDFESLKAGQDWPKEIERGIKQSDFFLVVLTPDAIESEWVGNEVAYANNSQKMIIPLHYKKCEIPINLTNKQYIDFEKQTHKAAIEELIGLLKGVRV